MVAMRRTAYNEDLAYVHDAGHRDFSEEASKMLLPTLRAYGFRQGRVIDLGCGPGHWARRLATKGYEVLGIDISPSMIALARSRVPDAEFRVESLWDAELPECSAVTAIGECLNYIFDKSLDLRALRRMFQRIHAALKPGGLFVFDLAGPGRIKGNRTVSCRLGDNWVVLVTHENNARRRCLTRHITVFRKIGRAYRRTDETHVLHLYPPEEVKAQLRRAGFHVQLLRGYGTKPFPPGLTGFLAQKPR